ncbi:hypothetical protein GJAV_G00054740 [Gymnothorax javanicus]|nr:hypothetical protein GJAV_G00054740 [Gymnothorax javanicus]
MADLIVSLFLLALFVLLCEAARKTASKLLGKTDYSIYVVETISTIQLCACTHELKLLGECARAPLPHKLFGFTCISPINATLPKAAAVELACAFAVQTAVSHVHSVDEKYRVHFVAAVITAVVYAGGGVTGAVFNPALAYSTQFRCSGHTFAEYSFVYWLGPILGVASSLLLFDKVIPIISGKSSYQNVLDFPTTETKKAL